MGYRHTGENRYPVLEFFRIPVISGDWIPAYAGMTNEYKQPGAESK
jgi:hypothetical protein